MNMLVTLFGGVALVVLIYQMLRALGFSNYWRGVISGVVPLVAYAIYATGNWAGLDVMAIHTAVYLSTATVLAMLGSRQPGQDKQKAPLHWAPMVFIAFFAVVILLNTSFLYISTNGVPPSLAKWFLPGADKETLHTGFPGVVPHGVEAAKEIGSELTARNRQMRLGWRVEVTGLKELDRDGAALVVVNAQDRDGSPMQDAEVTLDLLRPAQATRDQSLNLPLAGPGQYQAWVSLPEVGRWIAVLHVARGGDDYKIEQQLTIDRIK